MSPSDFKKYIEDHFITPNGFFYINRARKHPEAIKSMKEHTGIGDDMTAIYCAYHNIPCKKCLGCVGISGLNVSRWDLPTTHVPSNAGETTSNSIADIKKEVCGDMVLKIQCNHRK